MIPDKRRAALDRDLALGRLVDQEEYATAQLTLADEEPRCDFQAAHNHCKTVRCTNCPHYNSGLRN